MKTYVVDGKRLTESELDRLIKGSLDPRSPSLDRVTIALNWVEGERVLDVGCGIGYASFMAAQGSREVFGVDVLPSNVEVARDCFKRLNLSFLVMDAANLGFEDCFFDCILCLEVIEHFANPVLCVTEFARVLKSGGVLIVSTPNAVSVSKFVQNLLLTPRKRASMRFRLTEDETPGTGTELDHVYIWDALTLFRLLNRCGFKYVDHVFTRTYPSWARKIGLVAPPFREVVLLKVRKGWKQLERMGDIRAGTN